MEERQNQAEVWRIFIFCLQKIGLGKKYSFDKKISLLVDTDIPWLDIQGPKSSLEEYTHQRINYSMIHGS